MCNIHGQVSTFLSTNATVTNLFIYSTCQLLFPLEFRPTMYDINREREREGNKYVSTGFNARSFGVICDSVHGQKTKRPPANEFKRTHVGLVINRAL